MLRSMLCAIAFGCGLALSFGQGVAGDKAVIIVRVPADAVVFVAKQKTSQTGPERRFTTPPLPPGTYTYEVTATWSVAGIENTQTKQVNFAPGQITTVSFVASPAIDAGVIKIEPKKIDATKAAVKTRSIVFTYAGKAVDLPPGKLAKVWLPLPATTPEQDVVSQKFVGPGHSEIHKDKVYGNSILFFEAKADEKGEVPFRVDLQIKRHEVQSPLPIAEDKDMIARFLQPDQKVPVTGKPLELIKDVKLPADSFAAAKVLYDVVNGHMRYSKEGKGWGQGDAVWACDSKFGNCTDFHSLFISMARGNKIPSKFEMGFSIPPKHGQGPIAGYHCWAWFSPDGKCWVPVDISEANRHPDLKDYYFGNLTEDRVQFSTGRDIILEPRQSGPPLNFFIHPYVEVDGQPYAGVQRSFAYRDVD